MLDPLADKGGTAIPATDAPPRPYAEGLDTPCVIVDLTLLERNIAEMAALAYEAGVALRPHVKTHKTPQIAAMQLDAGAVGLTCAKVGEAEVLADSGFTDLFVCFPLVTEAKARRLAALAARPGMALSTIVDSPQGVAALSAAFAGAAEPLETLVKVDTGLGRVGVAPGAATVDLARSVEVAPGLRFGGVCAHEGFTYGLPDPEERAEAARVGAEALAATAEALSAVDLPAARVSVGATPGMDALATTPGVTEIRPGNYVFYDAMQVGLGAASFDRCALRVLATVVSHAARDRAVIDAGSKTLTTDRGAHGQTTAGGYGAIVGREDIHIERLSEEHGWLRLDPAGNDVEIGEILEIVPVHACPVANLAHELMVVRDDTVLERWGVAAAGRVR
jgi:D-serine deaminase-like pyridoxal phosphate-dependent protein